MYICDSIYVFVCMYVYIGPLNQDAVVPGLLDLAAAISSNTMSMSMLMSHLDLLLRYLCCVLCLRETSTGLLKTLQLLTAVCVRMKNDDTSSSTSNTTSNTTSTCLLLSDLEASFFLPHLIDKSGSS